MEITLPNLFLIIAVVAILAYLILRSGVKGISASPFKNIH